MKIAVWDTYVQKPGGETMHFDILVPEDIKEQDIIFNFGRQYLNSKGQHGRIISAEECKFCHIEVAPPEIEKNIAAEGYAIIEMENCN